MELKQETKKEEYSAFLYIRESELRELVLNHVKDKIETLTKATNGLPFKSINITFEKAADNEIETYIGVTYGIF